MIHLYMQNLNSHSFNHVCDSLFIINYELSLKNRMDRYWCNGKKYGKSLIKERLLSTSL